MACAVSLRLGANCPPPSFQLTNSACERKAEFEITGELKWLGKEIEIKIRFRRTI
jgi:hypothetical protein